MMAIWSFAHTGSTSATASHRPPPLELFAMTFFPLGR